MKITKLDKLEQFNSFISNLTSKDNIALMHDTDADGITAAVIVAKSLEKKGLKVKSFLLQDHSSNRSITNNFLENIKQKNITKLICVDIALEDFIDANKITIPVLVIDHHQSINHNTFANYSVYKPSMVQDELKDDEVCAANLAYKLFETIVDVKDLDWIVSIGIIGDYTFKQEKEFLKVIFEKYNIKEEENIFDTRIGLAVQHITFANCMRNDKAIHKAVQAVINASNIEETMTNLKDFEVVSKEINRAVDEFEEKKEILAKDLLLYIYSSPYKINSPVSSIISTKYFNNTILTLQELEGVYKISARRQDKTVNMGTLLNQATEDLENANGGGHIPAAGGQIQRNDLDTFINKVKIVHNRLKEEN